MRILDWRSPLPVALLAHSALTQLVTHSIRPTISYRALELGVDQVLLGVIAAAFAIVPVLGAIPIGRAADRGRIRSTFVVGAIAQLLAVVGLLTLGDHVAWLMVSGILLGLGHVCAIVAQQTVVSQAPTSALVRAFGSYTFFGTLGQIVAPLLLVAAGTDRALPSTTAVFAGAGVAAVLALGLAVVLATRTRGVRGAALSTGEVTTVVPDVAAAMTVDRTRRARLLGSVAVSMAMLALVDVVAVYLPGWGLEMGVAAAAVGVLLTVRASGMLVGRLFARPLVRIAGAGPLQVWSAVVAGLSVAAILLPVGYPVALVAMLVSGLAVGVGQPVSMAYVSATAPPGTTSTWLSVRLAGNGAGMLAVPSVAGAFAGLLGAGGVIVLAGGGVVCVALATIPIFGLGPRGGPHA